MSEIKSTLLKGDCLDLMFDIPDGSVDMVMADPPYGTTACKWDSIISLEPMWKQLKRVVKKNGVIVMTASQPFTTILISSNMENYKYQWYWKKNLTSGFQLAKTQPRRAIEDILVFYDQQTTYNPQLMKTEIIDRKIINGAKNGGGRSSRIKNEHRLGTKALPITMKAMVKPHNLLNIKCEKRSGTRLHSTQKPVALMEYLIKTYTNESEIVLDFCMGSGTTGVACKNLNRNFIGIELAEKDNGCFELAKERIETHDIGLGLLGGKI